MTIALVGAPSQEAMAFRNQPRRRRLVIATVLGAIAIGVVSLSFAVTASAQESSPFTPDRLTGTLKAIKDRGAITIGYRENSIPFSFRDSRGQAVGYSIDLCAAIVEQVMDELGGTEVRVDYRAVTPENRFALLLSGEIGVWLDHQQSRAAQAGGVLAAYLRRRHKAAGQEGRFDQGSARSQG
jgi:ABC-type amino acid transport substrate-binding protein